MKRTLTIFKKEIKDSLRDRRTVIIMVLLPLLVFPLLMTIVTKVTLSQKKKAEERILNVGLIDHDNASRLKRVLLDRKDMKIKEDVNPDSITEQVRKGTYDFVIVVAEDFDQKIKARESGKIELYYKQTAEINIAKKRVTAIIYQLRDDFLNERLAKMDLDIHFVEPVNLNQIDLASAKEKIGEYVGGFIPYIFVIFCFVGAMYPAIDLAAGEKERYTIETLLTSPASRLEIVYGKFMVITVAGLISAGLAIVGLYFSLQQAVNLPKGLLAGLIKIIEVKSIILILSLLVPLCVFFAAILLSISIFANSFKEAQSIMTPMNFIVIIPVLIGLLPGIKLDPITAAIPILNVSLATKDIIAGSIKTVLLIEVFASLFIFAGLSLYFCSQWFKKEEVIFRGI